MTIAVIGSRSFTNYELLCRIIAPFYVEGIDEIISGGAIGTDSLAAKWSKGHGIKLTEILPDYNQYGDKAPLVRNEEIIRRSDMVLAFWTGDMKSGTRNALNHAKKYRKPTFIIYI